MVVTLTGFAGNGGHNNDECACGIQNRCNNNVTLACNSDDLSNATYRNEDTGIFNEKQHLPVSKMCIRFRESNGAAMSIYFYFKELVCTPGQDGKH